MLREMAACAGGAVASREAGFQGYWQAIAASITEAAMPPPEDIPIVDADAHVQQMQTALSSLTVRADQHDIEDREVLQRARVGHV